MKKLLLLILSIYAPLTACAPTPEKVVILIHGTWAHESSIPFLNYVYEDKTVKWFEPGHSYHTNLAATFQAPVIPFTWSGNNKHADRIKAAQELKKLIQSYPSSTEIIIVSHSHGSNVGFIASQLLAHDIKNEHAIAEFYAFGTPINTTQYMPDMRAIGYLCNFFSLEDMIQPVLGMFERVLPAHERIANIRTFIGNKEPDHADMHHPLLAMWVASAHEKLKEQSHYSLPYVARFFEDAHPFLEIEENREELIARDKRLQHKLSNALFRKAECNHEMSKKEILHERNERLRERLLEFMM